MSNFKNLIATAAAATIVFTGSAFAATVFAAPSAGNAPYFNDTTFSSQLQRGEVEAKAAAHQPASGEFSANAASAPKASTLTRAEVESRIAHMPAAGEAA